MRRSCLRFCAWVIVVGVLASCSAQKEVIEVGYLGPLTGPVSKFGLAAQRGFDYALEEVNADGGLFGKPLKASYEDTKCQPRDTITALTKFHFSDEKDFIVGPLCGGPVMTAHEFAENHQRLMISTSGLTDEIPANASYLFRMYASSSDEGRRIAEYAREQLGLSRVYIMYFNSEYGFGYLNAFREAFVRLGGEIVGESDISFEDKDFRTILTEAKSLNADGMYAITASGALGGQFYKQAREMGLEATLLSNYSTEDQDTLRVAGDALDGIYYTSPFNRSLLSEKGREFVAWYEEEYEPMLVSAMYGYEALKLYVEAASSCGDIDEVCMRSYLRGGVFDGLSGSFSFSDLGAASRPVFIKQVQKGEFITKE